MHIALVTCLLSVVMFVNSIHVYMLSEVEPKTKSMLQGMVYMDVTIC